MCYISTPARAKVVFVGAPGAGKRSAIQSIHRFLPESRKRRAQAVRCCPGAEWVSFECLAPPLLTAGDDRLWIELTTVPGDGCSAESWQRALRVATAVVFVADSRRRRLSANRLALDRLWRNLEAVGADLAEVPVLCQWNHRDARDAMPLREMAAALALEHRPWFETVAWCGLGLLPLLRALGWEVSRRFDAACRWIPRGRVPPAHDRPGVVEVGRLPALGREGVAAALSGAVTFVLLNRLLVHLIERGVLL